MSSQDTNNKEGLPNYTMDGFEGSIINLEEIFQFKIGAELEEFTFNFSYNEELEELKESIHELITVIVSELIREVCSKLPEDASKEHIVIDNMALQEILEKLRCKCDEIKDKLSNKYREYDVYETQGEDDDAGMTEHEDVSIDSETGEDELDENKSMDEAGDADMSESISSTDTEYVDLSEYLDVREYAMLFVNKILNEAKTICAGSAKYYSLHNKEPGWDPRESAKYYRNVTETDESSDEEVLDFRNPKLAIRDFKPELGKILVHNFIKTWYVTKDWMYWIECTTLRSDTCCDFHYYQVIWSLPTTAYPIPQIRVTVFFVIQVCRVIPNRCPVKVKYYFESCGLEFSLADEVEHEAFLYDILCQKQRTLCAIRI